MVRTWSHKNADARKARLIITPLRLTQAALRIYTSHLFKYLNGPLRKTETYGLGKKAHPLPETMMMLDEAIKKLRLVYLSSEQASIKAGESTSGPSKRLYRGMKMLDVGNDFMSERRGGTEIAPMSTTTDLPTAIRYGLSPESLLFVLAVDNFVQMGADLQWVSCFPTEAEVVFPPLTYLQPTGRTQTMTLQDKTFKIVEVTPHLA